MSTKRYRQKMHPPCGCTFKVQRRKAPLDTWCRVSGSLYRVTLAQTDWTRKGKYQLVCGYHRAYMGRAGVITASEKIT